MVDFGQVVFVSPVFFAECFVVGSRVFRVAGYRVRFFGSRLLDDQG